MDNAIASRLYEYRKANGYSQEELADKIGVSRQAVSKWERGESSPDTENLIALSRLYGITIDELINNDFQPKDSEPSVTAEAKDIVSIGKDGINVESAEGDKVHIGFDGIRVNDGSSEDFNDDLLKHGKNNNSAKISTIITMLCVIAFILIGALMNAWFWSWICLLFIPIGITAVEAAIKKNPSVFCYPVLVIAIYCFIGLFWKIWHPTWVMFLTIPAYYAICELFKSNKKETDEG